MNKFDLQRFLSAQEKTYERAISELRSGRKTSHWMWFIFPQLEGLAKSETAYFFSIKSFDEAKEYLDHPTLGNRLRECTEIVLNLEDQSVSDIFGYPDDLKFHSSMTLFAALNGMDSVFQFVLDKYFDGQEDERSVKILQSLGFVPSKINSVSIKPERVRFSVFAQRVTKAGKSKCGDSFLAHFIEKENLLLLAIADGVSSSPCDWMASETACKTLVERFSSASGCIHGRMEIAAAKTHSAVRQIQGYCAGSITSLTFVVWEVGTDQIYFLNVGDSRIYVGQDNDLEQITSDDVLPVLLKRNGEVVLNAGVPVFMRGVTRSLGQGDPLQFEVRSHEFGKSDVLLLVSDGITMNEAFTVGMEAIFNSTNVEERLLNLVRENSSRNKDDATMIAVWRHDKEEAIVDKFNECLSNWGDYRALGIGRQQIVETIKAELTARITAEANSDIHQILNYAEQFRINFDREFLSSFLSAAIRQGTDRPLVTRLRDLIRRT